MADLKITQLPEETSPVGADLLAMVDDVAGTPTTKKVTLTSVATLMGTLSGGNHTYTSAHASPPATPGAGDLWLPTDSFYAYRYSGSLWVPWGPIYPMTPPVDGDFAWINQGSATIINTGGALYLKTPTTAGENVRMRVKTAPSPPYTITAAFMLDWWIQAYHSGGLLFRQISDGKLHTLGITATLGISSLKWTSATASFAYYVSPIGTVVIRPLWWMQISDDGTNRIVRLSMDGYNWDVIGTIGRTDYLTADQVGFFAFAQDTTRDGGLTLLSWKET